MEELVNKFETFDMNESQNVITEFISKVENDHQSDILLKLYCGRSGNMYLSDYKFEEQIIRVEMLGSRTSKGCREQYTISINNSNRVSCNCKDFTFRSNKLGIVCKHICFILCKVSGILDTTFFETKKLTDFQFNKIKKILENNALWKNRYISVKDINKEFQNNNNNFNPSDICPICCDSFQDKSKTISCPQCKNYIHEKCMSIWLERKKTCVYCRSEIFSDYINDVSRII